MEIIQASKYKICIVNCDTNSSRICFDYGHFAIVYKIYSKHAAQHSNIAIMFIVNWPYLQCQAVFS